MIEPGSGEVVVGTVTISGVSSDSDGEVDTVKVRLGDSPWEDCVDDSDGDPWSKWYFDWDTTQVSDGTIAIKVRATDEDGGSTDDTVSVTVDNSGDTRPTVSIVSPGDGPFADNITIGGSASDPDGSVDRIEVSIDDNSFAYPFIAVGTGTWMINLDISRLDLGAYTVYVRAVDDEELASGTDSAEIDVDNRIPIAMVDLVDPETASLTEAITFSGHGENGDIFEYRWTSDLHGNLGEAETIIIDADILSVGVNTIRFRVKGANGLWSDPDTVTVTVRSSSEQSSGSSNDFQSYVFPMLIIFIVIIVSIALIRGSRGQDEPNEVVPIHSPEIVTAGPAGTQAPTPIVCPTCGGPPEYYPQYGRNYCHNCQQYLP